LDNSHSSKEMNNSNSILPKPFIFYFIIIILPFLMFFWMIPFIGNITLGNDYTLYPTAHQMELMFSIKTGSFPLYIPGFAGGQSSSALTLGQIFHPISWISAHMPGYWDGKALEWNTLFRLLSLGLTQLLLFEFLRRLKFNNLVSFLLSFVTVYNLRMLDLFRYGASLESWTGHLLLCTAIGLYYLNQKGGWKEPLFIIGSTYWLVCSGHPQMMYYGLLGAGLFALIIPYFVSIFLPEKGVEIKNLIRFWGKTALFCCAGIVLSSAYIVPFYFDFMTTSARIGKSYEWANMYYTDTFIGTINNFFQPLRTTVDGNFGGTSLFIIPALIPLLLFLRVRVPRVIWATWILVLFAFLHMQGDRTPVHYIVWKCLPLASSFRVAGRIAMIIPILLMLMLAWLFRSNSPASTSINKKLKVNPVMILACIGMLLITVYNLIPNSITSNTHEFCPANIHLIPNSIMILYIILGMLALLTFCIHNIFSNKKYITEFILCIITCIQVMILLGCGTWMEYKKDTPNFQSMTFQKIKGLDYQGKTGVGLNQAIIMKQVERSYLEPFLGKFYSQHINAQSNEDAYSIMERGRTPDQVVLEGYNPKNNKLENRQLAEKTSGHVKLIYSSFNRLIFEVSSLKPGFLGLSYPYNGHWRAILKKQYVPVYRANGASHAVYVPAGTNLVEFRYWSTAAFVGIVLSCSMIIIIGFIFMHRFSTKNVGYVFTILSLIFSISIFIIWYYSLYTGKNLNTVYTWESSPETYNNLAYSKRTEMSSSTLIPDSLLNDPGTAYLKQYPYLYTSGKAVDGDRSPKSGFITALVNQPWWRVDLNRVENIGSIVIYESLIGDNWNVRPLMLAYSNDKITWGVMKFSNSGPKIWLHFNKPITARYVEIMSSGYCKLSFDEVEIYPLIER